MENAEMAESEVTPEDVLENRLAEAQRVIGMKEMELQEALTEQSRLRDQIVKGEYATRAAEEARPANVHLQKKVSTLEGRIKKLNARGTQKKTQPKTQPKAEEETESE